MRNVREGSHGTNRLLPALVSLGYSRPVAGMVPSVTPLVPLQQERRHHAFQVRGVLLSR
jgi:hypothetical protein